MSAVARVLTVIVGAAIYTPVQPFLKRTVVCVTCRAVPFLEASPPWAASPRIARAADPPGDHQAGREALQDPRLQAAQRPPVRRGRPVGARSGRSRTRRSWCGRTTGTIIQELQTESIHGSGITYGNGALWITSTKMTDPKMPPRTLKVDPKTGKTLKSWVTPGSGFYGSDDADVDAVWRPRLEMGGRQVLDGGAGVGQAVPDGAGDRRDRPIDPRARRAATHGLAWDNGYPVVRRTRTTAPSTSSIRRRRRSRRSS